MISSENLFDKFMLLFIKGGEVETCCHMLLRTRVRRNRRCYEMLKSGSLSSGLL